MFQDTVNKLDNPAQTSTFGRSKGNIFLVDTKSRQVIWSTYDPPKGSADQGSRPHRLRHCKPSQEGPEPEKEVAALFSFTISR